MAHEKLKIKFKEIKTVNLHQYYLRCEFDSTQVEGVLNTILCDKVCQSLAAGLWFSSGTPVSSITYNTIRFGYKRS
jgi:hypothetical protein